ncbi:MAG: pilus assembly PilX family protein [Methylotenera sp.]
MSHHAMNSNFKTRAASLQPSIGHGTQQGVVLFIALIALVVMSLAAVALIRSVDTNTMIAGNLAAKQSATTSADSGLETALIWLGANPTILDADSKTNGYYATQAADPITFAWDATDSLPAGDASGNIDANGMDKSGNTIRYVIQRMCRTVGASNPGGCLFGAPVVGSNSQSVKDAPNAGAQTSTEQSPMYRITAKVTSAKNTTSYIQAFVY